MKNALRRTLDASIALGLPGGAKVAPILRRVEGWLYPHEAVYLYWLARTAPGDATLLEVGSFRGRSTLCLAAGLRDRGSGRVHAVDPHAYGSLEDLRGNLAAFGLADRVEVLPERSMDVFARWKTPLQAAFLDGDHSLAAARADVVAWSTHVVPGGLLVLHDSTPLSGYEGPRQVAREIFHVGDEFEAVGTLGSITWGRRRSGSPPWIPPEHGKGWLDGALRLRRKLVKT